MYAITSNRESGFGRYDVVLEPKKGNEKDDAIIIEFKVHRPQKENDMQETVQSALLQIEEKGYAAALVTKGIPAECIKNMDLCLKGKTCCSGKGVMLSLPC